MAQERNRSNREVKKPKAVKPASAPTPTLLSAGKTTPIKPPKKAK